MIEINESEIIHLGDAVYISYDGYQVELRANDPFEPSDVIFLDKNVIDALLYYFKIKGITG